jgi:hypothetical protein
MSGQHRGHVKPADFRGDLCSMLAGAPTEPSPGCGVQVGIPRMKLMTPDSLPGAPRGFQREIAIAVAAKSAALVLIYLLFFTGTPPASPPGDHLFLAPASQEGAFK